LETIVGNLRRSSKSGNQVETAQGENFITPAQRFPLSLDKA